jgi:hypothetical protein
MEVLTMNKKTMLEKIELFRRLVSEINISKYQQNEYAEIVQTISLEIFTRNDVETLRNLEADD